jgi:hypothetical protein
MPDRSGTAAGQVRYRVRRDVEEFGGDGLAVGDAGAPHDVHGLVAAGHQRLGDGGGRHLGRAVEDLPGVVRPTGPGVLGRADGHAHARRGDRRAHTAAALQPAFEFELFQCLPERGAGDAEAGGEVALVGQDLAHGELRVQRLAEHGPEVPVLRFRHRFQLRGPHPVLHDRRVRPRFSALVY